MAVTLDLDSSVPKYQVEQTFDGIDYIVIVDFNDREQAWYFSLLASDGVTVIQAGIKVVVDFPLGARSVNPAWPTGMFLAYDTSGQHLDPGALDLGERVTVVYFSRSELAL